MKQYLIKLAVIFPILLLSCKKDKEITPLKNIYLYDVEYGNDIYQRMDINLPAGRSSNTPVLFFIHGGSWIAGDKSDMTNLADFFFSKGFATVNLNYRLANDSVHYNILNEDITSAINFIRSRQSEYYISDDKFALFGHSAGAHLALISAYKNNSQGLIKAVVSLAGPTKLSNPFYSLSNILAGIEAYTGTNDSISPNIYKEFSPLYNVSVNTPPTYIIHGTNDLYVDVNDSRALAGKLDSIHVKNTFL